MNVCSLPKLLSWQLWVAFIKNCIQATSHFCTSFFYPKCRKRWWTKTEFANLGLIRPCFAKKKMSTPCPSHPVHHPNSLSYSFFFSFWVGWGDWECSIGMEECTLPTLIVRIQLNKCIYTVWQHPCAINGLGFAFQVETRKKLSQALSDDHRPQLS